jgi:hypothetical protein
MRKVVGNFYWSDLQFLIYNNIEPMENLCVKYLSKYKKGLLNCEDGRILFEQANWNIYRTRWMEKDIVISNIYRSKRFKSYSTSIEKTIGWLEGFSNDSSPSLPQSDLLLLRSFPDSFL